MSAAIPNLFPALDAATEAALRESIQRFGVLVPVVRDQHGRVLDGHHRSRLGDELGVKYRVDVVNVESDEQAREIAATLNTDRRQLDASQRREIVAALREQGHSTTAIAGAVGVSDETVRRDLAGSTHVEPERVTGRDGKSYPAKRPTIVAAKNEREAERAQAALATADVPAGRTIDVKRAERIAREQGAEALRAEPVEPSTVTGTVEVRHGDLRSVFADLHGKVDAIVTDPPYPAEYIEEFDALGELAAALLKDDGVLVVMVGQSHLPAYIERLGRHVPYRWCGAYLTDGPATRIHARAIGTKWKPILLYGSSERFLTQDVFVSGGDDKRHHGWGQSESGMADLVERLTDEGALVVDPFLGGGTTAVVCRELGRRFIGCDIDAAAVHATRARLAA